MRGARLPRRKAGGHWQWWGVAPFLRGGRRWEHKPPWGDGDRGALGAPRPYSRGRGRGRGGGVDPSEGSRAIGRGGGRSPKPPFFSPRRGDDGSYFPVNKDRDGKKSRLGRRTLAGPRPWPCVGPAGPAARSPSRLRPPLHVAPLVGSSRPALQTPARSSPPPPSCCLRPHLSPFSFARVWRRDCAFVGKIHQDSPESRCPDGSFSSASSPGKVSLPGSHGRRRPCVFPGSRRTCALPLCVVA